jgi:cell fate regulator YaaT (PSP1 superfamily)
MLPPTKLNLVPGMKVMVETNRGKECGVISTEQSKFSGCQCAKQRVSVQKILGEATPEDIEKWESLEKLERDYYKIAKKVVNSLHPNAIVKMCELLFGQKKLYIYCIHFQEKQKQKQKKDKKDNRKEKDEKLNITDIVRLVSEQTGCRTEVKEVGDRGAAKVLGGIGSCGLAVCCSTILKDTRSITAKMAKKQGLSMNPKNLCGLCGKLKCCLRYEVDNYENGELCI